MRFLIFGIAVALFSYSLLFPFNFNDMPPLPKGERISFYVYPGEGIASVGEKLKRLKVIKSVELFFDEAKRSRLSIRAGGYFLSEGMSVYEAIEAFKGKPILEKVTIPEGLTAKEIAKVFFEREIITSEEEFLNLVFNGKDLFKGFKFLKDIPSSSVEGYLFPDTYHFPKRTPSKDVISAMLKRFERVISPKMLEELSKLGLSFHEVIILASIVEKEGQRDEEYPIIAAVFYNRLKRGMKLESCATVEYLLKERKARLSLEDLKINSPYNTYIYKGLPPGPICNPGLKSITAVFFPARVDYLYFVSKGDGGHHFSRTYEEHVEAKNRYLKGTGQEGN
ncbi:MAG: endolytic transglycosylase MltG [Synergistetes bacterium]|nr:endolytic transglycosylase MltG [Synergistota bacterium]MDW8192922.1 endolytic transglycosylase MltG [Synergistota bacterium]